MIIVFVFCFIDWVTQPWCGLSTSEWPRTCSSVFLIKFKIEKESKELPKAERPLACCLNLVQKKKRSRTVNIFFISTSTCIWWEDFDLISTSLTLSEKFQSNGFHKYCHLGLHAVYALNWLFFNPSSSDLLDRKGTCKSHRQRRASCHKNVPVLSNSCGCTA